MMSLPNTNPPSKFPQLMRLPLTNKIMANATVVIAEIESHPALWQLYNKMLGLHLAKPVILRYISTTSINISL